MLCFPSAICFAVNVLKDLSGKLNVSEQVIKDMSQQYMAKVDE